MSKSYVSSYHREPWANRLTIAVAAWWVPWTAAAVVVGGPLLYALLIVAVAPYLIAATWAGYRMLQEMDPIARGFLIAFILTVAAGFADLAWFGGAD